MAFFACVFLANEGGSGCGNDLPMKLLLCTPEHRVLVYYGTRCESPLSRDEINRKVQGESIRLLVGTDAASEGLNLQRLGTLINIDLPWNPTRLEQRKGRIQRIGQARTEIWIANLRYRGSVEDRVHKVLADRLEAIHGLFGQI